LLQYSLCCVTYSTAKMSVLAYIFVSPGDAPATITQLCCIDEKTIKCLSNPCSMYLSIFNSFRVIRCLSQCVSPKIAILSYFCFLWGRLWGNHAICCIDGKTIQCLQMPRSTYPSICNSFPVIRTASAKKITVFAYRSPHFCFP